MAISYNRGYVKRTTGDGAVALTAFVPVAAESKFLSRRKIKEQKMKKQLLLFTVLLVFAGIEKGYAAPVLWDANAGGNGHYYEVMPKDRVTNPGGFDTWGYYWDVATQDQRKY